MCQLHTQHASELDSELTHTTACSEKKESAALRYFTHVTTTSLTATYNISKKNKAT